MMKRHWMILFLRSAAILFAVAVIGLMVTITPAIAYIVSLYALFGWVLFVRMMLYVSGLIALVATYHGWRLLDQINHDQLFSSAGMQRLRFLHMMLLALFAALSTLLPFAYVIAEAEDAPGLILMVAAFPGVSLVMSAIAGLCHDVVKGQTANQ